MTNVIELKKPNHRPLWLIVASHDGYRVMVAVLHRDKVDWALKCAHAADPGEVLAYAEGDDFIDVAVRCGLELSAQTGLGIAPCYTMVSVEDHAEGVERWTYRAAETAVTNALYAAIAAA